MTRRVRSARLQPSPSSAYLTDTFLPCPLQYKVNYMAHCEEVLVETDAGHTDHVHEEDPDYVVKSGKTYRWTSAQTEIVFQGVRNEAKPKVIMRNLRDANVFEEGKEPTALQLSNKIQHCRSIIHHTHQIFTTHELRQKINEVLEEPEDEHEAFVAYFDVKDEDETEDPRFTVIWTTKNLMKRVNNEFIQDDATYRLTWQGYPLFISGTSTATGKFFPTFVTLCSHEDAISWGEIFKFVKNYLKVNPKYRMGDGAPEITKAGVDVFGDSATSDGPTGVRLICWSHVYRNVTPQLRTIQKVKKNLAAAILEDIEFLQWSCHSEKSFRHVYQLLEDKYLKDDLYDDIMKILLKTFFDYFRNQWVDGPEEAKTRPA